MCVTRAKKQCLPWSKFHVVHQQRHQNPSVAWVHRCKTACPCWKLCGQLMRACSKCPTNAFGKSILAKVAGKFGPSEACAQFECLTDWAKATNGFERCERDKQLWFRRRISINAQRGVERNTNLIFLLISGCCLFVGWVRLQ